MHYTTGDAWLGEDQAPGELSQLWRLQHFRKQEKWLVIVLDACRYDVFRRFVSSTDCEGEIERLRSPALHSQEWALACWTDAFPDVTYVSGNQFVSAEATDRQNIGEFIDLSTGDVTKPEAVRDTVLEHTDSPKVVSHFMQPHAPYYGSDLDLDMQGSDPLWMYLKAYRENLEYVWKVGVEPLLAAFSDRPVVITSDHGETFDAVGDGQEWRHQFHLDYPEVRHVPWLELGAGEYSPSGGSVSEILDGADEDTRAQLRALGYLD